MEDGTPIVDYWMPDDIIFPFSLPLLLRTRIPYNLGLKRSPFLGIA